MPVPSAISDLSQTAGSNYPAGSESPSTTDDYLRTYASYIAKLRDGQGHTNAVSLASATTTDIGGQTSQFVEISGTTTITSFGTNYNGPRFLKFTGALTLTHNATSLVLPTGANITTVAGDTCIAVPNQALNGWTVYAYAGANAQHATLTTTGNVTLGDASTDTVTVNGYMGVGVAPSSDRGLNVAPTALTGTSQYGGLFSPTATSAATSDSIGLTARGNTAAASFTVTNSVGFYALNAVKGAGSTMTNQHGVYIADQTQGTNNYGLTSLVSSGTNKWNIYASGTAANYFAGNVGIGATPTAKLHVEGATQGDIKLQKAGTSGVSLYSDAAGTLKIYDNAGAAERFRIDSSGNVYAGATATSTAARLGAKGSTADSSAYAFHVENSASSTLVSARNDGQVYLGYNGSGQVVLNNGQLNFPATQSASANANCLDDYEEGQFTPTIVGTSTAGAGTYTAQVGRYEKIGGRVFFSLNLTWTAHTGTGNMDVSGLPFTASASLYDAVAIRANNIALTAGNYIQGRVNISAATITLEQIPTGGGAIAAIPMDTSASVFISGSYEV